MTSPDVLDTDTLEEYDENEKEEALEEPNAAESPYLILIKGKHVQLNKKEFIILWASMNSQISIDYLS